MRSRRRQLNHRPIRRNPEWSWDVLDQIWPRLKEIVPDRLMPIVSTAGGVASSVTSSDRRLLSRLGVSHARSGHRNPVVQEYGAGAYGVVMPTRDPKWVFKITRDRSEASFVNALRNLGLTCSLKGISRYSTVYDTGLSRASSSSAGRFYIFWRESAEAAGERVWVDLAQTSRRTMAKQAQQRIIMALDDLRNDGIQEDEWLHSVEDSLHKWYLNPLLSETAADLLELMKLGIVVTDVHLGNWGIMRRRPKLVTLIDPGGVWFLTSTAREAAQGIPRL